MSLLILVIAMLVNINASCCIGILGNKEEVGFGLEEEVDPSVICGVTVEFPLYRYIVLIFCVRILAFRDDMWTLVVKVTGFGPV